MVKKQTSRRKRDIKTKLMAAVCMLMVSSIMMVSTTYAWFTLSTAPEVKGITTAVGANGNLEMALLPKDGNLQSITSAAGDSTKGIEARNVTWGNLVDLSDSTVYGLDKITLFPSALNLDTATNKLQEAMLLTPTYGADGRVDVLDDNTFTGYYNSQTKNFTPDDYRGVRAVGTASGMTDRQLDYRNARSAGNNATAYAKTLASQSLNTNGSALANIAIEHGMGGEESYTVADVNALKTIVNDLNNSILPQIEIAYKQYILAYAASAQFAQDTVWQAVDGAIDSGKTLTEIITALGGESVLPEALKIAIGKYDATKASVAAAKTELDKLDTTTNPEATFDWDDIKTPMQKLADTSKMTINGFSVSEVKANLGALVSSVTEQGGLIVTMSTGAGVYADIADQCGDFTASVNIEKVEYNSIILNNMAARMVTKTSVKPEYLAVIGTAVTGAGAPASGAEGTLPISDMYGYIIDLAFRTNAAESNLLLQVEAADRIYGDNTNESTMGGGSSMTFKATTTDFTDKQVKELMKAIRIVFFNPTSMEVIANAKLAADNATLTADGWKANMYLYSVSAGTTTTQYVAATYVADSNADGGYRAKTESDTGVDLYAKNGDEYIKATHVVDGTGYAVADTGATHAAVITTSNASETINTDNKIMPLTQNTATALSVLVYLDGNMVGNDDVAATASTSMKGTMNIQFASSANLVPMEYAALHQGTGTSDSSSSASSSNSAASSGSSSAANP